jgi:hypothetical protein
MTILSETIRFRAPGEMVEAADAWAKAKGETVSGLIRRLLAKEVPNVAGGDMCAVPDDTAQLFSDLLAGVAGAPLRLLQVVRDGEPEAKAGLLLAFAGYFLWEYRAPPDAAGVQELIDETRRLMVGDGD